MKRAMPFDRYKDQNRMAAEIIAGDPRRYPGLAAEWAAAILGGSRMIDLPNAQKHSGGARPSLQPLSARLAAPNRARAAELPELQDHILEPAAGAQNPARPEGQNPWLTGCSLRSSSMRSEMRRP